MRIRKLCIDDTPMIEALRAELKKKVEEFEKEAQEENTQR